VPTLTGALSTLTSPGPDGHGAGNAGHAGWPDESDSANTVCHHAGVPQSYLDEIDAGLRSDLRSFLTAYATSSPPRTIAVVGNAPLPPNPKRACRIDSADLVFRLNSFALDEPGEVPSHGTKVDVVVFSRDVRIVPHFFDRYRTRGFLMTAVAQTGWKIPHPAQENFPEDLGYWCLPNRAILQELRFLIWPDAGTRRVDPTTGTVAAWLGYSLFPEAELLLTGFSFLDKKEQISWEDHYFPGRVDRIPKSHRVSLEGALLTSWIDAGRATQLS
jgi:hypothetical protein